MALYQRPSVDEPVWRDVDGQVIAYGQRWGDDGPPPESYERESNIERFAPLHTVASELVRWLQATFDVTVVDDLDVAEDLNHPHPGAIRAIRFIPANRDAARLTIVFTSYPGVLAHAGEFHEGHYPWCGCDACDESFSEHAEALETFVMTVVEGRLSESVTITDDGHTISYQISDEGNPSEGGKSVSQEAPDPRTRAAAARLNGHKQWLPWQPRDLA